jgi:hypothetical protein
VSIDDAQSQVAFKIPKPSWLPEGLILQGAHVDPPKWAQTFYGYADGSVGGLGIEIIIGSKQGNYQYPDAAKQPVLVGAQSGFCVHGSWNKRYEWVETADAVTLEWSTNDFSYHIGHSGLGLTCEGLIRIAQSLE